MGDDQPRPGTSSFQATFCVVLQVDGRPLSAETPAARGPRNWGQLSSAYRGATGSRLNIRRNVRFRRIEALRGAVYASRET
jgi:hypothetical protein